VSHSQPETTMPPPASAEALMELLSPDGYYSYLEIKKTEAPDAAIDLDKIKKSYRKLSLKHQPDKPGGDADTFRVLNRAHKVLSDEKLRKQYDALGIDLHDDDDDAEHDGGKEDQPQQQQPHSAGSGKHSGIMQEIASTVLTVIFQTGVRTGKLESCREKWQMLQRAVPNEKLLGCCHHTSNYGGRISHCSSLSHHILSIITVHGLCSLSDCSTSTKSARRVPS
jgi:DnaJ domain